MATYTAPVVVPAAMTRVLVGAAALCPEPAPAAPTVGQIWPRGKP